MQTYQDQARLAIYVAGAKAANDGLSLAHADAGAHLGEDRTVFLRGYCDMLAWLTVRRRDQADLAAAKIGLVA